MFEKCLRPNNQSGIKMPNNYIKPKYCYIIYSSKLYANIYIFFETILNKVNAYLVMVL